MSAHGDSDPTDLEEMLDRMKEAAEGQKEVSVEDLLDSVGRRSFGPLLLLAGLIILLPLVGDIPGVPTLTGLVVLLISSQLLLGRQYFWFPSWILERSVETSKVRKAAEWLRRPAHVIDRFIKPRFTRFVEGVWLYVIASISLGTALITPAMEVVPFSANAAGAVLTVLGLALIARDGLMALIAMALAASAATVVAYVLLSG
jgi:hypothetical protein